MQIRVRDDSVEISGYVNAIERRSNPLRSRMGQFIERICKGAFKKGIERNDNIRLLENHDWTRDLGGTKEGNLKLTEDSIGLRADATLTDPEAVKKAKNGEYVGWSFGFKDREGGVENDIDSETHLPLRKVRDLDLYEVSLLDRNKRPAYDGTLVSVRSDEDIQYFGEPCYTDIEIRSDENQPKQHENVEETAEETPIDYTKYETMINDMREE